MATTAYETIIVETIEGGVGQVTLNRPGAMNALNNQMMVELADALDGFEADTDIGCIIITGSEKAFAAGADIKEMAAKTFPETYTDDFISGPWERVASCRKPVIAAVAGYALGGGCELAMMCDTIVCAENAKFGQPEITLGILPGIGGTQRMARAIGKAKAMDMILTGRMMDAEEAERAGLVSRIVASHDMLIDEAHEMARAIAKLSRPSVLMAKEAVNRAFELPLSEGVRFERRLFQAVFATEDQKEGMAAFIEKRQPNFKNK